MSHTLEYSERVTSTAEGGSIELRIKNFCKLRHQDIFENEPFEFSGVQWKLILFRVLEMTDGGLGRERLVVRLIPPRHAAVECKYKITIRNHLNPLWCHSEAAEWNSNAFHASHLWDWSRSANFIEYKNVTDPESGFLLDGTLVVHAEIESINKLLSEAGFCFNEGPALCSIEFIGFPSIVERMDRKKAFGIASASRKRMMVEYSDSTLQTILNAVPSRVWLCHQTENGKVFVRQCLNELSENKPLRDIVENSEQGHLWALLFVENDPNGESPDVRNNTSVIFCKLYDPEAATLTYIGHILVDGDKRCFDLFSAVADLAALSPGQKFNIYLETTELNVKEITNLFESIDGNGLSSGSAVVLRLRTDEEEEVSEESVQNDLCAIYANGLGLSDSDKDVEDVELLKQMDVKDEDDDVCVVCMERPRTAGFVHGISLHRCVCEDCAKLIEQTPDPRCPMCRKQIQHIIFEMY